MSTDATAWKQARLEILERTDVRAELAATGVRFVGDANANGWATCYAAFREERTPSAAVCLADGPNKGNYKDFGPSGISVNFFEFIARLKSLKDFREAVREYAKTAGVKLPKEIPHWSDRVGNFRDPPFVTTKHWCESKGKLFTPEAVRECGGKFADYPKSARHPQQLICFPVFGPSLLDGEPCGWHGANSVGATVSIWRGKDAPPSSVKTIQLGETGLINLFALQHLEEADIIWFAEGLSDTLALHAAIRNTEFHGKHVVMTSGGAGYPVAPEWVARLAGKDVRIAFDSDEAGRQGAAKWAAAFATACQVRNVDIEPLLAQGKKDIRDFLLAGGTYQRLLEFSAGAKVIESAEDVAGFDPHEEIAKVLQFHVAGEIAGSNDIEVFSLRLAKKVTIKRAAQLSRVDLIQHFGRDVIEFVSDSADENSPGTYTTQQVKEAIAALASERRISDTTALGPGVWGDDSGRVLVVGQRGAWTVDGGELVPFDQLEFAGRVIHLGSDIDWFDAETMGRHLESAKHPKWREAVWWEAAELFGRWDNWAAPSSSRLCASLAIATWVQTLWVTRPQIFVTGKTNSGKSWLIERTLQYIFGGKHTFTSKPTEAGLRQRIKDGSFPILVDEVDKCPHRQKVYDLLRTSTVGSTIAYGTADQKGKEYGLRHIAWLGGIETALNEEADQNRFIVLALEDVAAGRPSKLELLSQEAARDLGRRLLAVALAVVNEAKDFASRIGRLPLECDRRLVSVYAVPMAVEAVCLGYTEERAISELKNVLRDQEAGADLVSDEEDLLDSILNAHVSLDGGGKARVCDLLAPGIVEDGKGRPTHKEDVLALYGLRMLPRKGLFVACKTVTEKLLDRDNRFRASKARIDQVLLRISANGEKAARSFQRVGSVKARGIIIPEGALPEIEGGSDQDF